MVMVAAEEASQLASCVEGAVVECRWEAHMCLMFLKNGLSLSMTNVGISPVKALSERSLHKKTVMMCELNDMACHVTGAARAAKIAQILQFE